jgi:hypothetical protein
LIAVPSVWIGDSVFIPAVNYYIFLFLQSLLTDRHRSSRLPFFRISIISTVISSCIAGYTHYIWTQDRLLGFIDPSFGALSVAGWWHLIFTVLEMSLIFFFISAWAMTMGAINDQFARRAWGAFMWYTMLSIGDFLVLHFAVLSGGKVGDYTTYTAWQGLLVIPFWYGVRLFMSRSIRQEGTHRFRANATDSPAHKSS